MSEDSQFHGNRLQIGSPAFAVVRLRCRQSVVRMLRVMKTSTSSAHAVRVVGTAAIAGLVATVVDVFA